MYVKNIKWRQLITQPNLELAWVRARRYAHNEALTDEAELGLFDFAIDVKLDRLHKQMLACDWRSLNTEYLLQFDAPKANNERRPKTLARIEEQVLATAIIQIFGHSINRNMNSSYSYWLKNENSEYLYCYWLDLWRKYVQETHRGANKRIILSADVKEFYKHVYQDALLLRASRSLTVYR